MLRLRRLHVRNWLKIAETTLDFPDHGVVAVLGTNLAGRGKLESVGSGKTALGEAISRALLGVGGRYASLGHYSRDDAGDTYVRIDADLDGNPLKVELGFKCEELSRTGEGLRFSVSDRAPIERAHVRDTRQELVQTVGLTPEVAEWTVFLDGERLKFNKLSQTDALELLMHAMDQPPWQVYHERTKRRLDILRDAHAALSGSLSTLKLEAADALATLTAAREAAMQAETTFQQRLGEHAEKSRLHAEKLAVKTAAVQALQAEQRRLAETIRAAVPPSAAALTADLTTYQATVAQLEQYEAGWDAERRTRESSRAEAEQTLRHLISTPTACPTCQRAWDRRAGGLEIETATTLSDTLRASVEEAKAQLAICRQDLHANRVTINQLNQQLAADREVMTKPAADRLEVVEHELEVQRQAIFQLERQTPQAPVDDRASFSAVVAAAEKKHARVTVSLTAAVGEIATVERERLSTQYWATAFSPAGLPNAVLRAVIPPLNEAARTVSDTMTSGILTVSFEASTELANGQPRPQLSTKVVNSHGATRLSGNSKGEAGLVNLIIAETQTAIGRVTSKIGYRWFDEAVNSEDPVVRRNIYQYLKRQAAEHQILIFVVDHHPEAVNFSDHVLMAEKSPEGLTTFSWKQ